jgi:hypothetical protein
MTSKLTVTEAETLAVMLDSASKKIASVKTRTPGLGIYEYAWTQPEDAIREMFRGFYDIAPAGVYI